MSKDRVKFSDAMILGDAEKHYHKSFSLYLPIPKDKFESREFICDLVGHRPMGPKEASGMCGICGKVANCDDFFTEQDEDTCEANGHALIVPLHGWCSRCQETPEPPKPKQPNKTLAAEIKEIRDHLGEIEALIRDEGVE